MFAPFSPAFCHLSEAELYFCHRGHDSPVDITVVKVTTEDSNIPSDVWIACHDEESYWCHVMNAGDVVFYVPTPKVDDTEFVLSHGTVRDVDTDPDDHTCKTFAEKFTSNVKYALQDADVFKNLCEEVETSSIEPTLDAILTNDDRLCAKEVKLLLIQRIARIESTFESTATCAPQLSNEKTAIDDFLDATVCVSV